MLNIVLFGPPGAGKGTQSKLLIDSYSLVHLSTGDILRGEIAKGSELGKRAKAIMDRGDLVPDEVVVGMIKTILEENPLLRDLYLTVFLEPQPKPNPWIRCYRT